MKALLIIGLLFSLADHDVISRTACMSLGDKNIESVKAELLLSARRGAVEQLFGSLVTSLSQVDDLVLKNDQIRAASLGFVRIVGSPLFFNGDNLGEICVKIQAYTTDEDRAKLKPKELSKKACTAEGDIGTIRKRAEEKAIYEALTDYDATLKRLPLSRVLPLLHEVRFSEGDFVKDALTYCVRAAGTLYPIEAAQSQLEHDKLIPTHAAPDSVDITGSWEFVYTAHRTWNDKGEIRDANGQNVTIFMEFKQKDDKINGKVVGATNGACAQGTIGGTIKNNAIRWNLISSGPCCPGAEELFSGEVDQSSGNMMIRGKSEPKGIPPTGPCEAWWADLVGSRRL